MKTRLTSRVGVAMEFRETMMANFGTLARPKAAGTRHGGMAASQAAVCIAAYNRQAAHTISRFCHIDQPSLGAVVAGLHGRTQAAFSASCPCPTTPMHTLGCETTAI